MHTSSLFSILFYIPLLLPTVSSTILYEGATIIAFNESSQRLSILRDASLLIQNDTIAAVNEGPLSQEVPSGATRINATDKIISPGFIDTHHHLWQTAFKTIASNTSLADYFERYGEYGPAGQNFTPDDVYVGQLAGILELLYEGTTTVLDHAHASWSDETVDAGLNATLDSGIRAIFASAVHPVDNYTWDQQITKLRSLTTDPRLRSSDLVDLGLAYDYFWEAPPSNLTTLWSLSSNLSAVTTHYLGGPWGINNSPQKLLEVGWLNKSVPIVFSHSSFMDFADAQALRETDQYISTTAESEFHFGHNHPYAHLIQDQASLGIDCHFTYSSPMVNQARLLLQSLRAPAYLEPLEQWMIPTNNPMSVEQAFLLITRSGALALRRPDLGVVKVGAKADLVVFKTDAPNMIGWSDPVAAVILHSDVGDIEDVLVGGKFMKQGGKLVWDGYDDLRRKLKASARRIQGIWANLDFPPLTGSFFNGNGGPYTQAVTIDTQRGPGTGY